MVSTMTIKQAYDNGREISQGGQSIYANPFRNLMGCNEQYSAWIDGWCSHL